MTEEQRIQRLNIAKSESQKRREELEKAKRFLELGDTLKNNPAFMEYLDLINYFADSKKINRVKLEIEDRVTDSTTPETMFNKVLINRTGSCRYKSENSESTSFVLANIDEYSGMLDILYESLDSWYDRISFHIVDEDDSRKHDEFLQNREILFPHEIEPALGIPGDIIGRETLSRLRLMYYENLKNMSASSAFRLLERQMNIENERIKQIRENCPYTDYDKRSINKILKLERKYKDSKSNN